MFTQNTHLQNDLWKYFRAYKGSVCVCRDVAVGGSAVPQNRLLSHAVRDACHVAREIVCATTSSFRASFR